MYTLKPVKYFGHVCILTVALVFFKHKGKMAGFNFLIYIYAHTHKYMHMKIDVSNHVNRVSMDMV